MKKSFEELQKIRQDTLSRINNRGGGQDYKIVVGMATCGISVGARDTLIEIMRQIEAKGLEKVTVTQTGCMGMCSVEPTVEVYDKDGAKTLYTHMTSDKVTRLIEEHIVGGKIINEFLMAN